MELITTFFDFLIHLDRYLLWLVQNHGTWIYAVLFLIVFCETGLVVTPFLPGDSLLFAAGTIAAAGAMDVHLLVALLLGAAFLGDNTNYWIGRALGPRVFRGEDGRFFRREHLERTRRFYQRHGGKTVIIARFVPIVRTFAPFVAGIGAMRYRRFIGYSVLGALLWVFSLTYAGYFFGNLPWVKSNLTLVILGIILASISPGIIEYFRHRAAARRAVPDPTSRQ